MKLTEIKGLVPEKKKSQNGNDCTCMAYHESECGCSADWSDYSERNKLIDELSTREITVDADILFKIIITQTPLDIGDMNKAGIEYAENKRIKKANILVNLIKENLPSILKVEEK